MWWDHRRNVLLACSLAFAFAAAVFLASPVRGLADSRFCFLLSEQLLTKGRVTLTEYFRLPLKGVEYAGSLKENGYPYHFEIVNGEVYYWYPPGSSVLSVPLVAAFKAAGWSTITKRRSWDFRTEYRMQAIAAALLSTGTLLALFLAARPFLDVRRSLVVALVAGLATPIWSTTSRVVWSDTWGVFLLAMALAHLARHRAAGRPLRPILFATLLAWMYITKPTYAIAVLLAGLYAAWSLRRQPLGLLALAGTGLLWIGGLVAYSWHHFGRWLPSYFLDNHLVPDVFWSSLAGLLLSPSRGLFTTMPVAWVLLWLLVTQRRALRDHGGLGALCAGAILVSLGLLACWPIWWAGHCYGARFMAASVPWMALLAAILWHAAQERSPAVRFNLRHGAAVALVALSVAIQARGACSAATNEWNHKPDNIDQHPERLWDWRHAQPLAGWFTDPSAP